MAIDVAGYSDTILDDDCSGTPDNWTDGGGGEHSFSAGVMTVVDDSGATEYIYNASGNSDADWYLKIRMRHTASSSTPVVCQFWDASNKILAAIYRSTGGDVFAWNGAAWTDTGLDLAVNTWGIFEFAGNITANTYDLELDNVAAGATYDGSSGAGNITQLFIGGGTGAATWTMEVDYVLFKDTLVVGAAGAMSTNTGYWGPAI